MIFNKADAIADPNFSCVNVTDVSQTECQTLVALYNNNDGPKWYQQNNWLRSDNVCGRYGIDCADGHIFWLSLQYNNLSGLITPAISGLTYLEYLWLNGNKITSLPESIWTLTGLRDLVLDYNQISYLPQSLWDLNSLVTLQLLDNNLILLPASIANLTNLEMIYLNNNQLVAIPSSVGYLSKLSTLDLENNHLTSLPNNIWNLPYMESLYIDHNKLVSLPISIINLGDNLWEVQLDYNCLDIWIMDSGTIAFIDNTLIHNINWREDAFNTDYCPPIFTFLSGDTIFDWPTQVTWFTSTWGVFWGDWKLTINGPLNNSLDISVNNLTVIASGWWDGVIQWPIPDYFSGEEISIPWYTQLPVMTFQIGNPNAELEFSNNITVNMYVGSLYDGNTLLIYRSIDYGNTYQSLTSCLVTNGICSFDSNWFSLFTTLVPDQFISCQGNQEKKNGKCIKEKKEKKVKEGKEENILLNSSLSIKATATPERHTPTYTRPDRPHQK